MTRAYKGHKPKSNPRGYEQDAPKKKDTITPSDVWRTKQQSGPVRHFADMSPAEKARVLAQIRRPGVRE